MTNPPSVASQGSGGAQTYPKGILKKSVQAAFEGERPSFTSTTTTTSTFTICRSLPLPPPPAPCLSESSKVCLPVCALVCVLCV